MSDLRLAGRYQAALQDYLAGMQEPALQQAYELGRQALAEGLGILDLATVHGEALARALVQTRTPEASAQVAERATDFFVESASAFEMIDRGFQEANTTLRRVNSTLEQRTAELQAANQELARDADQYATMMATTPDGFWRFDKDGKLLEVNAVYCQMSGYSRDELLRLHISDLEAVVSPEEIAARIRRVMHTGFDRFESLHRKKDGGILDVEISVSFWPAANQFLLFARDITKRKRAEALVQEQYATLESIIESADGPIFALDKNYRYIAFNQSHAAVMRTLYGAAIERGRCMFDYQTVEADRLAAKANLDRALNGESLIGESYSGEETRSRRYFQVAHNPVKSPDGQVLGVAVFARDLTERRRAEDQIRQLNEDLEKRVVERTAQLEAANRELEAFSYSISHDLRAPLATIDGFARLLLKEEGMPLAPEARNYARLIHANAQEMQKLIVSLLDFSRSGRQTLQRKDIAPAELARTVVDELLSLQTGRQVETVLGELPPCQADPILLKQVFANLLSNALKFTRTRPVARIEIGACPQGEQTAYFVRDNGVGFDMEQADKLFGVFQRLHRAEDFEGNGVGLAIVARIVRRHGGRIWADAHVDQGATFYFTLGDT